MKLHDNTNVDLKTLSLALDTPLDVVTTATVDNARAAIARTVTDPAEAELFRAMLGIDDVGRTEGVERGLWTEVWA